MDSVCERIFRSSRELEDFRSPEVPPRLERRGEQKKLDCWVMYRYLLRRKKDFLYPISVKQSESPDFVLKQDGCELGVEITEACDPDEQAKFTNEAREDESRKSNGEPLPLRTIGDRPDETAIEQCANMIAKALLRKKKDYSEGIHLVVYLNSHVPFWLEEHQLENAAKKALAELGEIPFGQVWLLYDGEMNSNYERGTQNA